MILYNDKCIRCLLFEYPLAHPESQTSSQHARGDMHCSTQFFKGPNLYKDQIKSDYGMSLARHKHNHVDILSVMHVTHFVANVLGTFRRVFVVSVMIEF